MFQKPSPEIALTKEVEPQKMHDDVETVVGPSVHVEGDFASEGDIVVKGTVSGNVKTSKLLTVEKSARIFANVKAGNAVISGQIKGNVKVVDKVEVNETARIEGDVHCKVLVVAAGALIMGKVSMKGINIDPPPRVEKKRSLGRAKLKSLEEKE